MYDTLACSLIYKLFGELLLSEICPCLLLFRAMLCGHAFYVYCVTYSGSILAASFWYPCAPFVFCLPISMQRCLKPQLSRTSCNWNLPSWSSTVYSQVCVQCAFVRFFSISLNFNNFLSHSRADRVLGSKTPMAQADRVSLNLFSDTPNSISRNSIVRRHFTLNTTPLHLWISGEAMNQTRVVLCPWATRSNDKRAQATNMPPPMMKGSIDFYTICLGGMVVIW